MDMERTWKWLADGWRAITSKAADSLTYFAPGKDEVAEEADNRWGLLAADVSDHADRVVVSLEAPGLDKDDIDIDVRRQQLIVTGRKSTESERREGNLYVRERAFGRFERVIPLPCEVTAEGAQARYKKGVLTVELPHLTPPERRKITVKAG